MSLVTRGLGRGLGALLVTAGLGLAPVDTGVVHARATQTLQSIASTAQVEARVAAAANHSFLEIGQSAQSIAVDAAQAAQQVEQVQQVATSTVGAGPVDAGQSATLDPPSQTGTASVLVQAVSAQTLDPPLTVATALAVPSGVVSAQASQQVDPFIGEGWGFHLDSGIVGEGWIVVAQHRTQVVLADGRRDTIGLDVRVDRVPADLRVDRIPAKPEPVYTEFRMKELRVDAESRMLTSLFETRRLKVGPETRRIKIKLIRPVVLAEEPEVWYID